MTAPRRIGEHTLDALKGWRINDPVCIDHRNVLAPTWDEDLEALEGMVVHATADGFLPGCDDVDTVPMFLRNNWFDADVQNYGGDPATEAGSWVPAGPTGVFNALVATGGYELLSTEIDLDNLGDYTVGALLTSPTTGATAGKLTAGVLGTDQICAQVSRPLGRNPQDKAPAVSFFTVWFPVYP